MAYNENYKFIEILSLKDDKQIELVMEKTTKELAVRKVIKKPCSFSLYRQIMENPHDHIVTILSVIESSKDVEIIEEYLRGESCAELLKKRKMDLQEIIQIALQLSDGLWHLHQLHPPIIHRDIKPENIMITTENCVQLIDFDISRNHVGKKKKDTQILGSLGYAAPEQFGFNQSDARSDIYAVGVLMNVLSVGAYPNEFESDEPLRSIIKKCVEIDAAKRFQSCLELKNELRKLVEKPTKKKRIYKVESWGFDFPGFRSGNWAKAMIAICMYAFILCVSLTSTFEDSTSGNSVELGLMRIAIFLWMLSTVFLFSDYRNCFSQLVKVKYKNKRSRLIAVASVSTGVLVLILILCVLVTTLLEGMLSAYQRLL